MRPAMILGILLLVSIVAPRAPDAQTEAHNEVSQAMEAIRQAMLANDVDKLDALLSDDCILVLVSGRLVTKPSTSRLCAAAH